MKMTIKSNDVVFFHHPCADGFTAAWAAHKASPDVQTVPLAHSAFESLVPPADSVADVGDLYFLDICPPPSVAAKLLERLPETSHIYVLDHHKSAVEAFEAAGLNHPRLHTTFDMDKSGARLAWEHFHPGAPVPKLIEIVEDRDLWRFSLPGAAEVSAFLFSLDYGFDIWTSVATDLDTESGFEYIVALGSALRRKHDKDVREMIDGGVVTSVNIGGVTVPALNVPYFYASEAGHALLGVWPNAHFAATFYLSADGWKFSLRSEDSRADVSEIARRYGGGGHRNSAGFRVSVEDLYLRDGQLVARPNVVATPGGIIIPKAGDKL